MRIKYLFSIALLFVLYPSILQATETKITLISGGEDKYRENVESVLTNVLNGMNKNHDNKTPLTAISQFFENRAFRFGLHLYPGFQTKPPG